MTIEKLKNQASTKGRETVETYACSCRSAGRTFAVLFVILLLLTQGMTFFIAFDGGHTRLTALILALVPLVGPMTVGVQLAFVGSMTALAVAALVLPCALTLLLAARFRDERRRALTALSAAEEDRSAGGIMKTQAAQIEADDRVEPLAPASPASPEAPQATVSDEGLRPAILPTVSPEEKRPAAPLRTAVKADAEKSAVASPSPAAAAPVSDRPTGTPPVKSAVRPNASPHSAADPGKTADATPMSRAEEEYRRAMEEVLSLLNKNDR